VKVNIYFASLHTLSELLCRSLTGIDIPYSVEWIGEFAFSGCSSLASVELSCVESIYSHAFENCSSLTSITIPCSVDYIGEFAFSGSGLTSITIEEGIESIGRYAFSGFNSLTSITIPDSVVSISGYAFGSLSKCLIYCSESSYAAEWARSSGLGDRVVHPDIASGTYKNLSWRIDSDRALIISGEGDMPDFDDEVPDGMYMIERTTAPWGKYYSEFDKVVIEPGITSIGDCAFFECRSFSDITIPESVTHIGYRAFGGCRLIQYLTIPGSVTSIGDYAFTGCSGLRSVTISEGVTSIGNGAFNKCKQLWSAYIPASVTEIGDDVFGRTYENEDLTVYCVKDSYAAGRIRKCGYKTICK